jgi:tetratricopeptide (TPR) repeat protein
VEEAEKKLQDIEKVSSQYGIDSYLAFTNFEKGINALEKGDIDTSQCNFLTALQLFMKDDNYINILNCCKYLGNIANRRSSIHEALDYYLTCISCIDDYKLRDSIDICEIFLGLAEVYHAMGKHKDCWEYAKELLKEASVKYSLEDFTIILFKVSSMVNDENSLEEYQKYILDVTNIYRQHNDVDKELEMNVLLNMLNMKMGFIDGVFPFFQDNTEKLSGRDEYTINISILRAAYYAVKFGNRDYSKKLLDMVSIHQAKSIKNRIFIDNRIKSSNETVYYAIDAINTAIEQNQRIILTYKKGRQTKQHRLTAESLHIQSYEMQDNSHVRVYAFQ